MRRTLLLALTVPALLALPSSASAAKCADADLEVANASTAARSANAVRCLVDNERVARGLGALAVDSKLDAAAVAHSLDMLVRNFFDHTNPDGKDPGDRIEAQGYRSGAWGENIAMGYETAGEVMTGWMASPGHCRNILASTYTQLGVGIAVPSGKDGGIEWTQNFGRPLSVSPPPASTAASACPSNGLVAEGTPTAPTPSAAVPETSTPTPPSTATATVPATAKPKVRFTATRSGARILVKGTVANRGGFTKVRIRVRRAGGRTLTRTTKIRGGGKFSLKVKPPRGSGRITVRASTVA